MSTMPTIHLLGPRAAGKARTRERVRLAAKALFEAEGYTRTQLSHIAEDAGVTIGTICFHFTSKAALYKVATGRKEPTPTQMDAAPDMLRALKIIHSAADLRADHAELVSDAIAKAEGRKPKGPGERS